jgi:hypothetical protein
MIRHTVAFKLKHAKDSALEAKFFEAVRGLAAISTVKKFEVLRQTSAKNPFEYGLSMEFDSEQDYAFYNEHPDHVEFVLTRWIPEVIEFMELDYVVLG